MGGIDISRFCVEHDIRYWCGLPDDFDARLDADMKLAQQIEDATGDKFFAGVVLSGVRVGGGEEWPTYWRWGFGRTKHAER